MEERKIPQRGNSTYTIYMNHHKFILLAEDRPDIKHLNRHVRSHICGACALNPIIWKDLGIELMGQDRVADLNTISANHRGDVVECCSSMFLLWLQRQPEANWQQLIDALIKIELNLLASNIKKSLISSEQQQSSQQGSTEGMYLLYSVSICEIRNGIRNKTNCIEFIITMQNASVLSTKFFYKLCCDHILRSIVYERAHLMCTYYVYICMVMFYTLHVDQYQWFNFFKSNCMSSTIERDRIL